MPERRSPSDRCERAPRWRSAPVLIGAGLLLLAAVAAAGWLVRSEPILRLLTAPPMVLSTALCFALAGIALIGGVAPPRWRGRLHTVLGTAIVVIGILAALEQLVGLELGLAWKKMHNWLPDGRLESGRMSLAAAIGFVLVGTHFVAAERVRGQSAKYWVNGASAAVVSIGLFKLASNALSLEALFINQFFQLVSLSTAVGFVAIGAGQWLAWRRRDAARLADDDRIVLTGSAWILVVGTAIGFAAVFTLARSTESALRDGLRQTVVNRADLLLAAVENRAALAESLAQQAEVVTAFQALQPPQRKAERILELRSIANRRLESDFSLVEFRDLEDEPLAAAVAVPADATLLFDLQHRHRAKLLWRDGLVLHVEIPVSDGKRVLGKLYAQLPMPGLGRRLFELEGTRWRSAQFICATAERYLPCLPGEQRATGFALPSGTGGAVHPAVRAFSGETGLVDGTDIRGQKTISAFTPAGDLGLALILSVHAEELLRPLGRRLAYLLPLMLALLAGGALLLRAAVKPLAERLHDSEERLKLALDGSRFALWDWNVASGEVYLSEQWQEMLGGTPGPTVTTVTALEALVHPDDLSALKQHLREALKGEVDHYDFEHRVRRPDGTWLWIRSRGRVVSRDREKRAARVTGTNADISARKRAEIALEHEATHDALTGLPNRSLFYDRLEQALKRSRRNAVPVAVLYLDIDKFKQYNDRYGHAVGDLVLREFGRRVEGAVRAVDTVARLAGDEFAVIAQDLARVEDAVRVAEKIIASMQPPVEADGHRLQVATSIGIAVHKGDARGSADQLVARADKALYAAKDAGRGAFRLAE